MTKKELSTCPHGVKSVEQLVLVSGGPVYSEFLGYNYLPQYYYYTEPDLWATREYNPCEICREKENKKRKKMASLQITALKDLYCVNKEQK